MIQKYYAHSVDGRPPDKWQPLDEHLLNVAGLARTFAEEFGQNVDRKSSAVGEI